VEGCALFSGGAGSPSNTKSRGPRPTSIPSGILVNPAIWPQRTLAQNWGLCPFRAGGTGSPSNSVTQAEAYLRTKWYPDANNHLATTDMGQKLVVVLISWGGGAGSPRNTMSSGWGAAAVGGWVPTGFPSNIMWPGPRPTSLPSDILIHPTISLQLQECHTPLRRNTLTDHFYH